MTITWLYGLFDEGNIRNVSTETLQNNGFHHIILKGHYSNRLYVYHLFQHNVKWNYPTLYKMKYLETSKYLI